MSARLVLVRHGETDAIRDGRTQGRIDNPLNAEGQRQAEALAVRLLEYRPGAIWSSPASRARATAQPLAAAAGLEVHLDERLAEMDYGSLDGLSGVELRERAPEFLERWRGDDPSDVRMPGGETLREVQARASAAAREAAALPVEGAVVLCTHNMVLRTLICDALGLPLGAFRRFRVDLASYTVFDVTGEGLHLVLLNERCHLEGPVEV